MPNTPTKTRQRQLQQGQAIVLIGLLILVLFAMLGLAIDSGRGYVDRRDQQAAVDAAALSAGDWYENFQDLTGSTIPQSVQVYENNLHLYSGWTSSNHSFALVGPTGALPQDTWTYNIPNSYILTVVATNTQFNGYEFDFSTTHQLPLAFMQIFGGPTAVTVSATATSIVGNQRQTPALLTLSPNACATELQGSGTLTVLGDVYSNGTACVDSNLHLAGNCYGQTGSNCSAATYYCYNSTPGFIPYPPAPNCNAGDTLGTSVVPAPTLPDPGYLAPSVPYYPGAGLSFNRGGYNEMTPGVWNSFSISSSACDWLDPGVYTWNGGYSSHGGLVSNELKAPNEELYSAPGTTSQSPSPFWGSCAGTFNVSVVPAASPNGIKHQGGSGQWGIEVTSARFDQFLDPTVTPNPCFGSPGCRRESAPSACSLASTIDTSNQGIDVNITQNSPGAQYYLVYINPNGCDGNPNNFSFVGRYLAPGWTDGGAPPATATGAPWTGTLKSGTGGWNCPVAGVTICAIAYNNLSPNNLCFAQARAQLCQAPDDEVAPQCFATCPAPAGVPQDNSPMALEYPPYTGGDVANENYCVVSPNPGNPISPCATAKVTPGAVQFYFPGAADCLDQNGNGSTHVFSGEQYNWIVIYEVPGNTCSYQKLNGSALTQYIGTIYSPTASWDILGSDTSPLAGQVICYAAKVTGSANAGIDFNPNFSPAPPAARLIN
ncbi:MAG TPA: pilus assembly protein TadG-related protein [Candidatus Dormibacteraeota bacterium]